MEEKTIISGKFNKTNIFAIFSFILAMICLLISILIFKESGSVRHRDDYFLYALNLIRTPVGISYLFYLSIVFVLVAIFFIIEMNFCQLYITDKRVYGKTAFGKMVDLPLDKISSVGTCMPQGIIVATSSGAIKFWLLSNQQEIYHAVSELLRKRQDNTSIQASDEMDKLQKLKSLLDSGVINQEEFDAKKKQLLGL